MPPRGHSTREYLPIVRFLAKVKVGRPDECWEWQGYCRAKGYGTFFPQRGKPEYAHRYAYTMLVGPIPAGLTIDHLCKNPRCVNPEHLEAVTLHENLRRSDGVASWAARRRHCPQGHPYDAENTGYKKDGCRYCRTCDRARSRRNAERRRSATVA